ncbi:MAG: hypothetical protein V6Z81_09110 [Parvularculales bacterium]
MRNLFIFVFAMLMPSITLADEDLIESPDDGCINPFYGEDIGAA